MVRIEGNLIIKAGSSIKDFSMPLLEEVTGHVEITGTSVVETVAFARLTTIGRTLTVRGDVACTRSAPFLHVCRANVVLTRHQHVINM